MSAVIDFILHIDKHLADLIAIYGGWTTLILFVIIFCETGLVVTPFLPGDSLLFAAGALWARAGLSVHFLAASLIAAAVLGNVVNYHIGKKLGLKLFENPDSRFFRRAYLERTQLFFDKYGVKAIVITRFMPILRTFAPFLAGVGGMETRRFWAYNFIGGTLWVGSLVYAGHWFGDLPVVRNNFGLVVIAIIVISVLPGIFEVLKARREAPTA